MVGSCPRCARRMEEGFTIDAYDYGMPAVGVWHKGKPQRGFWGLKTRREDKRDIVAWRCTSCGFLEFFAP